MTVARRPAWREPMVWLCVALPLAAVVGGFVLIGYATRDRSDAVPETVRRVAQVQVTDLSGDVNAAAAGLHARLEVERATGAVALRLDPVAREPMVLTLAHPSDARRDLRIALESRGDGRLVGSVGALDRVAYVAMLESESGSLRIAGRLAAGASGTDLVPRLAR